MAYHGGIDTTVPGTANYRPGSSPDPEAQRNAITALLLQQLYSQGNPNTLPADPSDPASDQPGVALDAVANPTANDIVASGFQGLSNAAPADVAAMNSASPATNAQAGALAAAINAGYNVGQPGEQAAQTATSPGYNTAGLVNSGTPASTANPTSTIAITPDNDLSGMLANPAAWDTANPANLTNDLTGQLANPAAWDPGNPANNAVAIAAPAAQVAQANPGFVSPGNPANNVNDNPGAMTGFTGPGFSSATDVTAGLNTGYGNMGDTYGGDIAGGPGTGFGVGTGPDAGLSGLGITGATGAEDAGPGSDSSGSGGDAGGSK